MQFQSYQIADTAAAIQEQAEDGSRLAYPASKFHFPQQSSNFGTAESLGSESLLPKFFDRFGGIGWQMPVRRQPAEEAPQSDQGPIDSGYLPTVVS